MRRQKLQAAIIGLALLSSIVLVLHCRLIPRWGYWYSSDWYFRLQTTRLLEGRLALEPGPENLYHDFSWANGIQQHWGLGVPLLRLPLECVALRLGYAGFPDRLALVGLLAVTSVILFRALISTRPELTGWRSLLGATCIGWIVLGSPPFVQLLSSRFLVYEESIAFGVLWALLQLALLIAFVARPRPFTYLALCTTAGVIAFFRPTAIIYGAVTFALALAWGVRARRPRTLLLGGSALFGIGVAALLFTNAVRFGRPLEFGYSLNASSVLEDAYALQFGYPFQNQPLVGAARELVGALFFPRAPTAPDPGYFAPGVFPLQAATPRFREVYFAPFDGVHLVLFAGAAVLIVRKTLAALKRRRATGAETDTDINGSPSEVALVVGLWSLASFVCLFGFYVRSPSMTSRYVADLAPAVSAGIAAGLILLAQRGGRARHVAAMLMFGVVGWQLYRGVVPAFPQAVSSFAPPLSKPAPVAHLGGTAAHPHTPHGRYRCGDDLSATRIFSNGIGWDASPGCSVHALTTVYLDDVRCVRLSVTATPGTGLTVESLSPIRVKVGLEHYTKTREQLESAAAQIVFCPRERARMLEGPQAVSVAWIRSEELYSGKANLVLQEISVVAAEE